MDEIISDLAKVGAQIALTPVKLTWEIIKGISSK